MPFSTMQSAYTPYVKPSLDPDEDWTKISDLVERRRIQNRLAQRTYRIRLKRRLQELERRTDSSDDPGSDDQSQKPTNPVVAEDETTTPGVETEGSFFVAALGSSQTRCDSAGDTASFAELDVGGVKLGPTESTEFIPHPTASDTCTSCIEASTPSPQLVSIPYYNYNDTGSPEMYHNGHGLTQYGAHTQLPLMDFDTNGACQGTYSQVMHDSQILYMFPWDLGYQPDYQSPPPPHHFADGINAPESETDNSAEYLSMPRSPDAIHPQCLERHFTSGT